MKESSVVSHTSTHDQMINELKVYQFYTGFRGTYTKCFSPGKMLVRTRASSGPLKVTVGVHSGIHKTILNKLDICWMCLSSQMMDLRPIARVFKKEVILSVEINCSHLSTLLEQMRIVRKVEHR